MFRTLLPALTAVLLPFGNASFADDKKGEPGQPTPLELFEQRIMPIFKSPEPASCVQCHLAAVDLKDYILPSHEQTFASLRDQGLIDLAAPEKSKILTLIQMGEKDRDNQARLLHEQTRQAEYEAFAAWVAACCSDPELCGLPRLNADERAQPDRPAAVIRHARKSRVVDSFVRNVWSQRMRCFPCHTPHEIDETNPQHRAAVQRHEDYVEQFGDRMHIFLETPEATLQSWIEKSRRTPADQRPLLNLDEPEKSLLVLKPTSKLPPKKEDGTFARPSYAEPVSHMGGLKMHVDDPSYKAFIAWMRDYGNVVGNRYASVDELPADNWYATQHVLLLQDAPKDWPENVRVQLVIYGWDRQRRTWQEAPVAFTQNSLTPRRMVVGSLFSFGTDGAEQDIDGDAQSASLPPGKYLIKAYVDKRRRLADDPTLMLGEEDYYGSSEIEARWGKGFPEAQRFSGDALK